MTVDNALRLDGDITGDGGVLKTVLTPGSGASHPEPGDEVIVHYTGTLPAVPPAEPTVFDSSRGRDAPFRFKLGEGAVIKGWDIATKTMLKGEKAKVVLAPAYAYGDAGSPPKIPPGATLEFEMELIGWVSHKDLFGDEGVIKTVIAEGEGWERPLDLAEVQVNVEAYAVVARAGGNLKKGEVLFSGKQTFSLGRKECPEAWEKVLRDMKKGAKVKLVCDGKYAKPGPGTIYVPEDMFAAKLAYELELVGWLKVEDVTKDGGVVKKTLTEGEGWERPNDGARVTISAKLRVGDAAPFLVHENLSFKVNTGIVLDGLDRASQSMKKGEKSLVTVKPKYAYELCPALAPAGVSANDTILIDAELIDFEKGKDTWSMSFEEKAEEMRVHKDVGNGLFKQGRLFLAMRNYERAISFFEYSTSELSAELRRDVNRLLVQCHLNIAACYERLHDTANVLVHCKKALELDPSNGKALFRRGSAYLTMLEFYRAESDLKYALRLCPESETVIKRKLNELAKLRAEQDRKDKKLYHNMFAGLGQPGTDGDVEMKDA